MDDWTENVLFAYCWQYRRNLEHILWRICWNSATADKKSKRLAAEGKTGIYIYDSRISVLIEFNYETDLIESELWNFGV